MKFGKLFYSSFVPEWNKQYMSYKRFKKILKKYRKQLRGYSGYSCGAKKSFVQAMIEGDANSLTAPRKNSDPPTPISAERARELLLELYAEFFTAIQEELEKVNEFFCFKEKELQDQFAALNSESPLDDDSDSNHTQQLLVGDVESSTRKLAALQKQYGQIYVTLHLLVRKYSKLNYNACVKIMKKFDKVAKDNRKQAFLKENVETLPFYARADDLLRGLARQVENRYIKTGLLLLAINNGNNTGGVVDKESVAHAAEKEYSRLLAMLEDAQVSSHVGWEWRAFFPISKDDFILSDPTTTSSCSATSYSATGECCDEVAAAAAAANKQRQQQQTVVADLWRHLNAPMTREQLCRVTEDRTDEYYIIPDCKYGLKLRNRNLLELKVRRDCHETELLSTATTTPVSSPSSSNNKSTSTKICVEKWEKALITALPAASEHHEQESDFEEKQVDKELHQIYDALRENTKFLRIAGLVQEELNDNNSNKDISNNNASSSSSSSSRIKKVLFRKLRVQNSELIKGLTLEQTDTHVAIITTTTTTTAQQQQQQQQHDFYFRSICVEGAKRDQVAQFVSESIVTPSCPPSTADAPTTSSATTTTSAANVGPNNNNNNNNRNNDELGTAATNTLLQSPYNSVVLGGASDLVTVLGHHCCTPMGYPELVLSLVQRFNNSRH